MRSIFYYQGHHRKLASNIRTYINSLSGFLSPQTARSPRAVGDALESLVAEKFDAFLGEWCTEYSSEFARRAMADLARISHQAAFCITKKVLSLSICANFIDVSRKHTALGWGQIQIANSNNIRVIDQYSRKKWMLQLCEVMIEFYPREIGKIMDRIDRSNTVREYWASKEDIWAT